MSWNSVLGSRLWATGACTRGVGICGEGASELVHELLDDTMEVEVVVEAALHEVDEVVGGDGHLLGVELDREVAHRGLDVGVLRHG